MVRIKVSISILMVVLYNNSIWDGILIVIMFRLFRFVVNVFISNVF